MGHRARVGDSGSTWNRIVRRLIEETCEEINPGRRHRRQQVSDLDRIIAVRNRPGRTGSE
jgi:hypothetical protein